MSFVPLVIRGVAQAVTWQGNPENVALLQAPHERVILTAGAEVGRLPISCPISYCDEKHTTHDMPVTDRHARSEI